MKTLRELFYKEPLYGAWFDAIGVIEFYTEIDILFSVLLGQKGGGVVV
jgi:hypothetical protein